MEQKKEAVYLINDERYLHLRENGAGVGFATYNKVTGEPLESGQISEKNLPPDGRNAISAARNWYLFELSDDDRKVIQQESVKILENIPQAGIGRRRIWEPETLPKDIRLINSHYDDLYRIPDGGVVQVDYPDGRSFTARLEHLDDYHFDMGGLGNVFHICQFAEVMERNHADFYPEIQTQDEQAAWELGGKGYLAIQSCEDGWDYTLYHSDYSVMDGGQLDAPELTIEPKELTQYKADMQEAFQKGFEDAFGKTDAVILPEKDIDQSLNAEGSAVYKAVVDGEMVGGAVVIINESTQHNHLDLLFVKNGVQSNGIGKKIWFELERIYPNTKVWETCTPYFDKRNIHFYVNVCGFHITEFFNEKHPMPDTPDDFVGDGNEGMFAFKKQMRL